MAINGLMTVKAIDEMSISSVNMFGQQIICCFALQLI